MATKAELEKELEEAKETLRKVTVDAEAFIKSSTTLAGEVDLLKKQLDQSDKESECILRANCQYYLGKRPGTCRAAAQTRAPHLRFFPSPIGSNIEETS